MHQEMRRRDRNVSYKIWLTNSWHKDIISLLSVYPLEKPVESRFVKGSSFKNYSSCLKFLHFSGAKKLSEDICIRRSAQVVQEDALENE